MNKLVKAAVFTVFTVLGANAQANEHHHGDMTPAAGESQVVSATGVVKAIDMENKKVTIEHEPVAALNWPAMTMRFTITPQTQLNDIKAGDKVTFNFVQQGNLSLLQDIKAQ